MLEDGAFEPRGLEEELTHAEGEQTYDHLGWALAIGEVLGGAGVHVRVVEVRWEFAVAVPGQQGGGQPSAEGGMEVKHNNLPPYAAPHLGLERGEAEGLTVPVDT